jgi:hypothetical protein
MSQSYNFELNKGDNQQALPKPGAIGMELELKSATTINNQESISTTTTTMTNASSINGKKNSQTIKRKRSYSVLTTAATTTTTTANAVSVSPSIIPPILINSNETLIIPSKHSKVDMTNGMSLLNYNNILNKYQNMYNKQNEDVIQFFTNKNEFSDLTLVFNDSKSIYASKSILAAASSIYKTKLSENVTQLEINDAKYEEMLDLLQFLYPQFHAKLNLDNITSLMRLSETYEMRTLADACREYAIQYVQRIQQVKLTREPHLPTASASTGTSVIMNQGGNSFNNFSLMECIQYSDGTRYPAFIECNRLCSWLKIYSPFIGLGSLTVDELIEIILNILQKLSLKVLQQSDEFQQLSESDKNLIYISRVKFLESELAKLDYFSNKVYDINLSFPAEF